MLCIAKEAVKTARLIILEGNIGVGKTTLSQELAKQLSYKVIFEPTASNPYLSLFYQDPKKYALKLQIWIYRQRYLTFVSAVKHIVETGQGVILDRSVYSDKVFAVVNRNEGNISDEGFRFYEELRAQSLRVMPIPHVTIFLNATSALCQQRINSRGRGCENSIPVEYLEKLQEQYLQFLGEMKAAGSAVLTFDWSAYGTSAAVCSAIEQAATLKWTSAQIDAFTDLVANPTAVTQALTMSWTFAEAAIDEYAQADHGVEQDMLERERRVVPSPPAVVG